MFAPLLPMTNPESTNISARAKYWVFVLLKPNSPFLVAFLQRNGYGVAEADSPDNLVALCLHNPVHAVIVDVSQLGEIEGWSVAQSVKMVRPSSSVILFCHGPIPKPAQLPTAVDALVSDIDLTYLLTVIDKHTVEKAAAGG